MSATRIVQEHDGRFAARNDEHPKIIGRGASKEEALGDYAGKLAHLISQEVTDGTDCEDWSGRDSESWKD